MEVMTLYTKKTRTVATLLALIMSLMLLTSCGDKKKEKDKVDVNAPAVTQTDQKEQKDTKTKKEEKDSEDSKDSEESKDKKETKDTAKDNSSKGSDKNQNTIINNGSGSPAVRAPDSSVKQINDPKGVTPDAGLATPTVSSNASDASDLANVDPAQAASSTYDTAISVSKVDSSTVETEEYPYLTNDKFESHIHSVWSQFKTLDKVKIKVGDINEYLNYVCLPLKGSFYEINCNGYQVRYAIDPTNTYAYMDVNWSYYINADQYNSCKSRAASIISGVNSSHSDTLSRIRAVHDYICAHNTYIINVDGAYNCLINGQSDCDGYTAAFQICMETMGIPCRAFATSNHIFNLIQLNNKWYAIDVTWDDQDSCGIVFATYFLLGKGAYSNYPVLNNMLADSNFGCSRVGTIANEAVLRSSFNIPSTATNLKMGGAVSIKGQNFTDSLTYSDGGYNYTIGFTFTNCNS